MVSAPAPPRLLPGEDGDDGPQDLAERVDDALGVAVVGPGGGEILLAQPGGHHDAPLFHLHVLERSPQQAHLGQRDALVDLPGDSGHIHPGLLQVGGHPVGPGVRVGVLEPPGVGHEPHVK